MLEHLKPERVMYYFEQLCNIPHGSYDERRVSDYCVQTAQALGLKVRQDEACNVVIVKEASEGYEAAPTVILQGHLDMVCEKEQDCDIDFASEGLRLGVDGDYIYAKGTTLGGDDGIAVAMALAILEDNELKHPRIEAVFTTAEEVGMDGAAALDTSDLQGKYMINIDSEAESIIFASCAGGMTARADFEIDRKQVSGYPVNVKISGLLGGHSGTEIDKCRANANVLLGRLLFDVIQICDFDVVHICGGLKDNAITREAEAKLCVPAENLETVLEAIKAEEAIFKKEFVTSDPGLCVTVEADHEEASVPAIHMASWQRVLFVLFNAPYGVQSMSADIKGLVESSLNIGIMDTTRDAVTLSFSIRSCIKSKKYWISHKLQYLTEMMGGVYTVEGEYPAWEYKHDSKLRMLAKDIHMALFDKEPTFDAIHAGLECGILSEKIPGIDIISIGPDILNIHTPQEKLSISSTERTYQFVVKMLEDFPKYCD